jgi:hypothetical protein
MNADKDRRQARLAALSDNRRELLLAYLSGAVPETVDAALDFVEDHPDGA